MNAMPRAIRLLASVLIGLPGAVMFIGGMVTLALGLSMQSVGEELNVADLLITAGISLALGLLGFSMVSAVEFLNGARRYRMPSHRIFPYVCLRLLEQGLAVMFAGFLLATMMSTASNQPARGLNWAIMTIVTLAGLIFAVRWQSFLGAKWRQELPIEPPAPDFGSSCRETTVDEQPVNQANRGR